MALEEGLVVPVVKYANQKGLKDISIEVKELAHKAKNNGLTEENSTGGTFTITNLGMFGIKSFSPIINQPEVAILGVNMITNTPVVENGEIVIKPLMSLSLTADHRAVDGAVAAQFLKAVKNIWKSQSCLYYRRDKNEASSYWRRTRRICGSYPWSAIRSRGYSY